METGGCLPYGAGRIAKPTTQAPSQSDSWGQSRPHISGRLLVSRKTAAAPKTSPFSRKESARGMSLPVGQASWQGAAGQWMQRSASIIAASSV